ncbi:MAG: SDR family NAD(P)-dependent oxidoreductase [Patescibacteria group bacterium]|jgi:UDP-glucuronate 4-epimerase
MEKNTKRKILKTILITGSAGFIGFHLAKRLLEKGYKIIGIDNLNNSYAVKIKKDRNDILKNYENFDFYKININNKKELRKIFKNNKIDRVCHLAAQTGVRNSFKNHLKYQKNNIEAFINIMECLKDFKINNFIYASSSSVYGNNKMKKDGFRENEKIDHPLSFYAFTKKTNELIARNYQKKHNIKCTGLRFFTVYGPYMRPDMAIYNFVKNIIKNKKINIYNYGEIFRDFTYVDDIVNGIIKTLQNKNPYEIINLGSSRMIKIKYLIEVIEKELGKKAKQKLMTMQPGDALKTKANIERAKEILKFLPKTNIEKGIKKFVKWYKEYNKE